MYIVKMKEYHSLEVVQMVVEPFVVAVVPWGGRLVAPAGGMVERDGGGVGDHCRASASVEASCMASEGTSELAEEIQKHVAHYKCGEKDKKQAI